MAFKFNPLSGQLDLVGSSSGTADGFLPYHTIPSGSSVTIAQYRQMAIHNSFTLEGDLVVEGDFILLEDDNTFSEIILGS